MASARIPVEDFERGVVPMVCPITGEPADRVERVSAVTPIGAKWLLLLLGVVPFVIVWAVTRKTAEGALPISPAGRRARGAQAQKRLRALGVAALAVPVALGGWYLTDTDVLPSIVKGVYPLAAAALALGGIVAAALYAAPTVAVVEPSGRWVRVEGAAPAFAEAVRDAVGVRI